MKELQMIQSELKVPKSNFNSFGKYNYRSCEDILEMVKPLCQKHNVFLILDDELVHTGDRYYVKATVTLKNSNGDTASTVGYAREDEAKKGMDGSQITGSASSYARKYALNGLFCIDDTDDADTDAYKAVQEAEEYTEHNDDPVTDQQVEKLIQLLDKTKRNAKDLYEFYGIEDLKDLTQYQYSLALVGKVDKKLKGEKHEKSE